MITETQLQELERLASEATPGPWKSDVRVGSAAIYPAKYDVHCFGDDTHIICMLNGKYYNDQWCMADQQIADAAFIAAAREAVPALIARVRQLEKEADWLTEFVCSEYGCPTPKENCKSFDCVKCWREAARKEVKGANNEAL